MVREVILLINRTLPLSARIPRGAINHQDRLPLPPKALREMVIKAVDDASSFVASAVFNDQIEIYSIGDFPTSICAELLTPDHRSIPRTLVSSISRAPSRFSAEAPTESLRRAKHTGSQSRPSPRPRASLPRDV